MPNSKILIQLLCLALSCAAGLSALCAETSSDSLEQPCTVSINLIKFDALLGDLDGRIGLQIPLSELNDELSPKRNYFLVDELTVTASVLSIKSNLPYSSLDNFLATKYQVDDAGSEFYYPFDRHRTEIKIFVAHEKSDGATSSGTAKVPIHLDTNLCSFEGYNVKLTQGKENSPVLIDLIVEMSRTTPARAFSVFIAVLMMLVGTGVFFMAVRVARSSVAPEIGLLGFSAALLFAFPAIRSSQPLVPPMGVLSDYLGFFWAESIVAVALIMLVICWIRRKVHA
jgi:hypothetical protein